MPAETQPDIIKRQIDKRYQQRQKRHLAAVETTIYENLIDSLKTVRIVYCESAPFHQRFRGGKSGYVTAE